MQWKIVHVADKASSSPELQTVDVIASVIEPKTANILVRQLNKISALENLRHVKRVRKRSVEEKVELSVILCLYHEDENTGMGMPTDVLQLASSYQLTPFKEKVAKYAAVTKEEWEEQCKLWPTSYHPSTNPDEFTGYDEDESQLIVQYMKFALRLIRTSKSKVVNAAVIVDPSEGKVIASANDQTFSTLSLEECVFSSVGGNEPSSATTSGKIFGDSELKFLPCELNGVSCLYPWRWTEPKLVYQNGLQKSHGVFPWHPLRHATLVAIEKAALRDRQLFPCIEFKKGHSLQNGGIHGCSYNIQAKRQKVQLSENVAGIDEHVPLESQTSEMLKPYLCTGFDIYIVWEPCAMCAMALVHQRIRRIFYAFPNPHAGALGSVYRLQGEKSLNHHYSVFRIIIPENDL